MGVDITKARCKYLLQYVSGLSSAQAKSISQLVDSKTIKCRNDLLAIKGLGPITFKNAAGFLRIPNSPNPLDNTNIHPEQYSVMMKILGKIGFINQNRKKLEHKDLGSIELKKCFSSFMNWRLLMKECDIESATSVQDLACWICYPNPYTSKLSSEESPLVLHGIGPVKYVFRLCDIGIPPKPKNLPPSLSVSASDTKTLAVGNKFKGNVQNITPFGNFIYIYIVLQVGLVDFFLWVVH